MRAAVPPQVYNMISGFKCPQCKSYNLGLSGWRWYKPSRNAQKKKRQQYICKDCGYQTVHPKGK